MTDEIQVTVRFEKGATIIDLAGDVTTFAEDAINQAYQNASADGAHNIIFKFRETDYINSAGIAILIGILPTAWTASTCNGTPRSEQTSAIW